MTFPYQESASPYFGSDLLCFNASFTRFLTVSTAGFTLWDNVNRTIINSSTAWPSPYGAGTCVYTNLGNIWNLGLKATTGVSYVGTIDGSISTYYNSVALAHTGDAIWYCGGLGCISALQSHTYAQFYDGATVSTRDVGFKVETYVDLNGIPWAIGRTSPSSTDIHMQQCGGSNYTWTLTNPFGSTTAPLALSNSAGKIVIMQGTKWAFVEPTTGVILSTATITGTYSRMVIINHDGTDSIWIQTHKYSLLDGSLQQTAVMSDWYADAATQMYDPENDALFGHYVTGQGNINWLFLNGIPDHSGGGGGGGTGVSDETRIRCWGFTLDGHDFYVVRLGVNETLVFDRSTRQWSHWQSPGRVNFRPHVGINWQGMTVTLADGGTDIIAGDDETGVLWRLDPSKGRDDLVTTGDETFTRTVTGGIALTGREMYPCNALEIAVALGNPSQTGAAFNLLTSDDLGKSWVDHGAVTTTASDYTQVVEWYGLGMMQAPGRIFQITDNGASVRIGRAQIR